MLRPNYLDYRFTLPYHLRQPSPVVRYLVALAATATAVLVTGLLRTVIDPAVSSFFLIAIIFVAWYAGLRAGLFCAALSAAACDYLFILPRETGPDDLLRLTIFVLLAVLVNALTMARREAEKTATRIGKQLAVTLRSIGDAVITTDAKGRVMQMNEIAQSLTGWTEQEARGKTLRQLFGLIDKDSRLPVEGIVSRVIRDNAVVALGSEVYMVSRDGTEIPISEIATPVRDAVGEITGVVLVLRNMTELASEARESLSLRRQLKLLDSAGASIFAVDENGLCLSVTKRAANLLGYRVEDLIGREIHDIIHARDGSLACGEDGCQLRTSLTGDLSPNSIQDFIWRPGGKSRPVNISVAPLHVDDQQIDASVFTITDLTEQQRSEEALLRLDTIVNSVEEAVVTHTVDGVISSWSRGAEDLFGFKSEEAMGRHISIVHPPGLIEELNPLFEKVADNEEIDALETVRIAKGGEAIDVMLRPYRLTDPNGQVTGICQIVRQLEKDEGPQPAIKRRNGKPGYTTRGRRTVKAKAQRGKNILKEPVTIVGKSKAMRKVFKTIKRVAPTESSVLITGATGTGKELVARSIHQHSARSQGPFVDINCSAIPETLLEAELFGHQRGTFTGADETRPGLFEIASGGTLFLDEVNALPLAAQAKLLRVIQERRVRRIGGRNNIEVDVRIISASNSDLSLAIDDGSFRADLFYRLRVVPLQVPDLCKRKGDVEILIDHFLKCQAEANEDEPRNFQTDAMTALMRYPWPGNVRELENAIEYALALGIEPELRLEDLPSEITNFEDDDDAPDLKEVLEDYMNDNIPLAEIEKRYILTILRQFGGNQVRAAAALGIDRSKLYRRLRKYGIKAVKFMQEEHDGLQFRGAGKSAKAAKQ